MNIETDFAAKNDEFKALVRDMAMQVAAMNPLYVKREDIPEDVIEHEREIARVQAIKSGKPEKIVEKIVDGRIEKYFGENIQVRRFVRYEMGEGLEKKNEDFAQEVAAQFNK